MLSFRFLLFLVTENIIQKMDSDQGTDGGSEDSLHVKVEKPFLKKSREIYKNLEEAVANKSMQPWPELKQKWAWKAILHLT